MNTSIVDYSNKKINFQNTKIQVNINRRIAHSETSQIYICSDNNIPNKTYCLKIVSAKTDDKVTESAINKEIVVLLSFTSNQNIIKILDCHSSNSLGITTYFILLEYADGGNLYDYLRKTHMEKKTLPESQIYKYIYQITLALKAIHGNKYAHRDIQPKNILLYNNGNTIKICDFDSATQKYYEAINHNTRADIIYDITRFTSQYYRAPEETDLYSGFGINEKTDIWALGLILFSMLFGQLPNSPFESYYIIFLKRRDLSQPIINEMKKISNHYLIELMRNLLKINPKERPCASDILIYMDKFSEQAQKQNMSMKERLLFGANYLKTMKNSIKKNTTRFCVMKLMNPFPDKIPKKKYIMMLVQKAWAKEDKIPKFYKYVSLTLIHLFVLSALKCTYLLHSYIFKGKQGYFRAQNFNLDEFLIFFFTVWNYRAQNSLYDKNEVFLNPQITKFIVTYSDFLKKKVSFLRKYELLIDCNNSLLTNDFNKLISKSVIEDTLNLYNHIYQQLLLIPFNSNCLIGLFDIIAEGLNEELVSLFNLIYYVIIAYKNTIKFNENQLFEVQFIEISSKAREYLERLKKYRSEIQSTLRIINLSNGESNYNKCIEYLQNVKYNSNFSISHHFENKMIYHVKMNRNNSEQFDDKKEEMILISNNSQDDNSSPSQFDFNEDNFVINKNLDFQLRNKNMNLITKNKQIIQNNNDSIIKIKQHDSYLNNKKKLIDPDIVIDADAFETVKLKDLNEKTESNVLNLLNDIIFDSNNSVPLQAYTSNSFNAENQKINHEQFNQIFTNNTTVTNQNTPNVPFANLINNNQNTMNMNSYSQQMHQQNQYNLNTSHIPNKLIHNQAPNYYNHQENNPYGYVQQLNKSNLGTTSNYSSNAHSNNYFQSQNYDTPQQNQAELNPNMYWNQSFFPQQTPQQQITQNNIHQPQQINKTNSNTTTQSGNMNQNQYHYHNNYPDNVSQSSYNNKLPNNTQTQTYNTKNDNLLSQKSNSEVFESANSQLSNINIFNIVENYTIETVIDNKNNQQQIEKLANEFLRVELCKPNFQYLISSKDIKLGRSIGFGGSSEVFIGNYRGTEVAVKKLRILEVKNENLKEFKREVSSLSILRHPLLVLFMGAIAEPNSICIVTEYCAGGTLFNVLHQRQELILTWGLRLRILLEIATGMNFLHTNDPPIIHRDLKSLNILLTDKIEKPTDMTTIKISDFGLSKIISQLDTMKEAMTGQLGTCHWMAPEVINSTDYTIKADVYSYAIIIWEICTRTTPYKDKTQQQISYYVTVMKGRPEKSLIPQNTPVGLTKLMEMCWDDNPDNRPSFQQIISYLKTIKEKYDSM